MYLDSVAIDIDNRCTACISHTTENFVEELVESTLYVKGFGGTRSSLIKKVTLQCKWEDDTGIEHNLLIPNSYYVT